MANTIYEVVLRAPIHDTEGTMTDPGRVVGIREMGTQDLLTAFRQGGQDLSSQAAAGFNTKLAALRLSVIEDNGAPLTYQTLQGPLWDQTFSLKETFQLQAVWSQIHEPGEAEAELGKMVRARSGG